MTNKKWTELEEAEHYAKNIGNKSIKEYSQEVGVTKSRLKKLLKLASEIRTKTI